MVRAMSGAQAAAVQAQNLGLPAPRSSMTTRLFSGSSPVRITGLELILNHSTGNYSGEVRIAGGASAPHRSFAAVASISTRNPGLASAATWTAERAGLLGWSAVPKCFVYAA